MSDFLKGSSGPTDMASRKLAVMDAVRQEIALTNAQQLMNSANEKCYEACITKPGASLSSGEQACLSRCLDRYMEANSSLFSLSDYPNSKGCFLRIGFQYRSKDIHDATE
ncbi:Tim10/DDP family zinc finger-domain-containing protein [Mycena filopes]|nr:Tim10/DDP family zinc finger-domain-containing protein [Mycena filopes]